MPQPANAFPQAHYTSTYHIIIPSAADAAPALASALALTLAIFPALISKTTNEC